MGTLQVRVESQLTTLPPIVRSNAANEFGQGSTLQPHKYPLPGKPHLGVNVKVNSPFEVRIFCN